MKLKHIKIHQYKCIEKAQNFDIEDDVTILVGMNESGKTSMLEAVAKTNYFQSDDNFLFNSTHDFPRKDKKRMDKSGIIPKAVTATYEITSSDKIAIEVHLGKDVFTQKTVEVTQKFDNTRTWNDIKCDKRQFVENQTEKLGISSKTLNDRLVSVNNTQELDALIEEYTDEAKKEGLKKLRVYYKNSWKWEENCINEYVARVVLSRKLPKFLYYDEYYALPSRISIEKLEDEELADEEQKTAKALFELADISIPELIDSSDFEDYKAELESTQAIISEELFNYWSSNQNLEITFDIDKKQNEEDDTIEHILDIRVKNNRSKVSLPLKNRSKGFNWFFSFLVWFKKIQEDESSNYILLLDEPGLNLHASAQADLLDFIEDLSKNYQIIYSTHSPFMIPSGKLSRVRTVVETKEGSVISDSIQEKDERTLFPLQAALGYDIAQNLFISKNNLLVEGVSELAVLQAMSAILEEGGKQGLREDVTIVPTGGLDKVATFISLLRGSNLKTVCLLDTFTNAKGQQRIKDLIDQKLIRDGNIKFMHEFVKDYSKADLEDLFSKEDYLNLFNEAFKEHKDLKVGDLNPKIDRIVVQINEKLGIERYNHYRPAKLFASKGMKIKDFSEATIARFEEVFLSINKLF